MIIPNNRLLISALAILPLSSLMLSQAELRPMALFIFTLYAFILFLDVFLSFDRLNQIEEKVPKSSNMTKSKEANFTCHFRNNSGSNIPLRIGFPFPIETQCESHEQSLILPASEQFAQLSWPCQPSERGKFTFNKLFLESPSKWGFWSLRQERKIETEFRVFPNLKKEKRGLAALFLNKGNLGIHAVRQVGKGRDFEKLREYLPGDPIEDIHWKSTAKRQFPITKTYQVEKTQEVYVIIDSSRLTGRIHPLTSEELEQGETAPTTLERYINSSLVLGLAAEQQGDNFGLVTFSDQIHSFVRARNGKNHYASCRDALYNLQAKQVTPDFEELFTFLRLKVNKRALLLFLTDMSDPVIAESFSKNLHLISKKHLVLVNMLNPGHAYEVFNSEEVQSETDIYKQLAGHFQWCELNELSRELKQQNTTMNIIDKEEFSTRVVTQYINVKQRQLL